MDQNDLFGAALNLPEPWKVVRSGLEEAENGAKYLYVDLEVKPGSKLPCPCCGKLCPVRDTETKRWRHMNFWEHATFLCAGVPRVQCPEHKVRLVEVPWARKGSGFTLMFEAFVLMLIKDMAMSALAGRVGEHDTRLWRIVHHYVGKAHDLQDWSGVTALAIDETATRKGHRYATVVVELDLQHSKPARLLFMTPERTAQTVGLFAAQMPAHGADPQQVKSVSIDMSPSFRKGVAQHLPQAEVSFDRYHVMQLAGRSVDAVRKALQAQGADLKGSLWALRGNAENLSSEQLGVRADLCKRHKTLARALALREELQGAWECPEKASAALHLKKWCSWARRSRLPSFKALALTIQEHLQGILAYYPHRLTSAAIEAINGVIQTARRRARGFRNFNNLRAIAYWMAGDLDLNIPSPFTHPI
jgi:transposase